MLESNYLTSKNFIVALQLTETIIAIATLFQKEKDLLCKLDEINQ